MNSASVNLVNCSYPVNHSPADMEIRVDDITQISLKLTIDLKWAENSPIDAGIESQEAYSYEQVIHDFGILMSRSERSSNELKR